MTVDAKSTLIDVAFAVCTALDRAGIVAVLTGGSAATFYIPSFYQSLDADFVLRYDAIHAPSQPILESIGFRRQPTGDYTHPEVVYSVEFPPAPLMIGSDVIDEWHVERRETGLLNVLTPTDCVRDRFMHYYAWGDISALEIAVRIAKTHRDRVDLPFIELWGRREAKTEPLYDVRRLERFLHNARAR